MARDEAPPFERGQTFYGGGTIDSNNLDPSLEGKEWVFDDLDLTVTGAKTKRSGKKVRCRCVRNVGAAALLPKRLVSFVAGTTYGKRVDGYADTTAEEAYPVDEFLPAAGVPVNDLFWIVVEGPATVLTDLAGADNNVINAGGVIVALTGATSGATTAGRVAPQDLTGATAVLAKQIQNRIGVALSSKTTANTNADLLIEVKKW